MCPILIDHKVSLIQMPEFMSSSFSPFHLSYNSPGLDFSFSSSPTNLPKAIPTLKSAPSTLCVIVPLSVQSSSVAAFALYDNTQSPPAQLMPIICHKIVKNGSFRVYAPALACLGFVTCCVIWGSYFFTSCVLIFLSVKWG